MASSGVGGAKPPAMDWKECLGHVQKYLKGGDCHLKREILRNMNLFLSGGFKIKGHELDCVRRRSILSLASYHSKAAAKFAVDAVWDTCYNDTAPFDRAP